MGRGPTPLFGDVRMMGCSGLSGLRCIRNVCAQRLRLRFCTLSARQSDVRRTRSMSPLRSSLDSLLFSKSASLRFQLRTRTSSTRTVSANIHTNFPFERTLWFTPSSPTLVFYMDFWLGSRWGKFLCIVTLSDFEVCATPKERFAFMLTSCIGKKSRVWLRNQSCDPARSLPLVSVLLVLRLMDEILHHPSTSRLWTGLKQVKLHRILIRIGPEWKIVRGDSGYGTPLAIWEMLHNSQKPNLIGIDSI
jgi:hypothetical protein